MIPEQFRINTQPIAESGAVVRTPLARFTILTSRLIRMEYDPRGGFEDRPSQVFWFRKQPVPQYDLVRRNGGCEVSTEHLHLAYRGGEFSQDTLSINLLGQQITWHFGDVDHGNLGGTARTLDGVCGKTKLAPGLMSNSGWTVIDDSDSLVFNRDGWLQAREAHSEAQDLYFLGYQTDYIACLQDFCKVSGPVPVIPRWILGNWWSRYWAYSQHELLDLMLDFRKHQVPLSVCITDMDWHLEGWTGYTWNRELFPDPPKYLELLHSLGLHTALNLHPATGIGPHEAQYEAMARAMGMDPKTRQTVKFDIENPEFAQAYFDLLHHPMEEDGVDFWWMDWQQGNPSRLPGLDLLWWINHLHFYDLGRDGKKRSFVFSRWGGLGNHRYPIGFSGDTIVDWDSLAFQPYFTATAANVGYGWWSHDIGGHMGGIEDPELYVRWVQFGVFSPILRLHSTKNPFHERRPWAYDVNIYRASQAAMQLRHALIPYLYSMSWRNYETGIPLILPIYYLDAEAEDAYACPNQYAFGSELIAAPFVTPLHPDTHLARQAVWLPEGDWFDFFTGRYFKGGGWQAVYGKLENIPVFARAGAIVPLGPAPEWGGLNNPTELIVQIFPGKNNSFELFEDDGVSDNYRKGQFALTVFRLEWGEREHTFTIEPVKGDAVVIPPERSYTLELHAIHAPAFVSILLNGNPIDSKVEYSNEQKLLRIGGLSLQPLDRLEVKFSTTPVQTDWKPAQIRFLLDNFHLQSEVKHSISKHMDDILGRPELLEAYQGRLTDPQLWALLEVAAACGVEHFNIAGEETLIMWNRHLDERFCAQIAAESALELATPIDQYLSKPGMVGMSEIFHPAKDFDEPTTITIRYGNIFGGTHSFLMDGA